MARYEISDILNWRIPVNMRWIFPLAGAVACSSVSDPGEGADLAVATQIDQPFELRVGERAFVEEADSYLRFVEVRDDSRCPSDALILCVWEGDAAVVVDIEPVGGTAGEWTLHTTLDPKEVDLGAFALRLNGLAPYPETTDPIPADDYVATFEVVAR